MEEQNTNHQNFLLQKKDGTYFNKRDNDFNKDVIYEDVDVATFDLENDGDLDLYVMSGGNEGIEGDPIFRRSCLYKRW